MAALGQMVVACFLVLLGAVFALYLWAYGARYTIDGAVVLFNLGINFFGGAFQIAIPLPFTWYFYLAVLPIGYSVVEFLAVPRYRDGDRIVWAAGGVIMTWLLVAGTDLASTYFGTGIVPAGAGPVRIWFANNPVARGIATVVFTFGPEAMFGSLVGWAIGRWRTVRHAWKTWRTYYGMA